MVEGKNGVNVSMEEINKLIQDNLLAFGATQKQEIEKLLTEKFHTHENELETKLEQKIQDMGCQLENRLETKLKQEIQTMGQQIEKQWEEKLDRKVEKLGNHLQAVFNRQLTDGFARHAGAVQFIKDRIQDGFSMNRLENPFTHETVIPKSISSYSVREVLNRPRIPGRCRQ